METLRSSLAATDSERVRLKARLDDALRQLDTSSRDEEAKAEALRAALEASRREVASAAEERREYGAEMEVGVSHVRPLLPRGFSLRVIRRRRRCWWRAVVLFAWVFVQ